MVNLNHWGAANVTLRRPIAYRLNNKNYDLRYKNIPQKPRVGEKNLRQRKSKKGIKKLKYNN